MQNYDAILGSSSPRRKQLLESTGLKLNIISPDIEEQRRAGEAPKDYVLRNAKEKSAAILKEFPDCILPIITADTIVSLDDKVLEKPEDANDAFAMLSKLSGKTHEVYTGVCILSAQRTNIFSVKTNVEMKCLSDEEIKAYIATGEPMDKAGSYGIQGKASYFVKAIFGSYTNVVGLPLTETIDILKNEFHIKIWG